jgi:hypothetical protein
VIHAPAVYQKGYDDGYAGRFSPRWFYAATRESYRLGLADGRTAKWHDENEAPDG